MKWEVLDISGFHYQIAQLKTIELNKIAYI